MTFPFNPSFPAQSSSSILTTRSNLPLTMGYTSGKYYGPSVPSGMTITTAGSPVTQANDWYVPFLCRKSASFDRIAIFNTGAVANNFRLGIYADNGGGHPGALVVDGGQVTTSGAAGDNAATISVSLTGGQLYWLTINCQTTTSFHSFAGTAGSELVSDFAQITNISNYIDNTVCYYAFRAYAVFPATATAANNCDVFYPYIRLRAA